MVVTPQTTGAVQTLFANRSSGATRGPSVQLNASGQAFVYSHNGTDATVNVAGSTSLIGTHAIITGRIDADTTPSDRAEIWRNNTDLGLANAQTGTASASNGSIDFCVGSGGGVNSLEGVFQELIIFNTDTSERSTWQSDQSDFFGMILS